MLTLTVRNLRALIVEAFTKKHKSSITPGTIIKHGDKTTEIVLVKNEEPEVEYALYKNKLTGKVELDNVVHENYPQNRLTGPWVRILSKSFKMTTTRARYKTENLNVIGWCDLHRFVSGDKQIYDDFITKEVFSYATNIDLSSPNTHIELAPVEKDMLSGHKFTKAQLMAYLCALNGPLDSATLLKNVARLQGKPYIPTSNKSYFAPTSGMFGHNASSVVVQGILQQVGKENKRMMYNCTGKGMVLAAQVIEKIGKDAGKL